MYLPVSLVDKVRAKFALHNNKTFTLYLLNARIFIWSTDLSDFKYFFNQKLSKLSIFLNYKSLSLSLSLSFFFWGGREGERETLIALCFDNVVVSGRINVGFCISRLGRVAATEEKIIYKLILPTDWLILTMWVGERVSEQTSGWVS